MVVKVAVFIMILVVVMLLWARSLKEDQAQPTPPSESVVAPISEGLKDGVIKSGERAEQKLKDSALEHGTTLKDQAMKQGEVLSDKATKAANTAAEIASDQALEAADQWRYMLREAAKALPEKK